MENKEDSNKSFIQNFEEKYGIRPLEGVRLQKKISRKYYYDKICRLTHLTPGKKSCQFTKRQMMDLAEHIEILTKALLHSCSILKK